MEIRHAHQLKTLFVAAWVAACGCSRDSTPDAKSPIAAGDYVVQDEKDDLSHIAVRAYGSGGLWYGLLNANPQLRKRPGFDLIPGETIKIPAKEDLDMKLPKSEFPKQLPADYIVMPGDSLHFIAENCYGDRELWTLIYEANRDKLSERVKEDTRRLFAGQVLHIPAKEGR